MGPYRGGSSGGSIAGAHANNIDRKFLTQRLLELEDTTRSKPMDRAGPPPIGDIHGASVSAAAAAEAAASEAERVRKLAAENAERDRAALAADTDIAKLRDLLANSEANLAAALGGRPSSDKTVGDNAAPPLPAAVGAEAHEDHMITVQLAREQHWREDAKEQRRLAAAAKRTADTL